MLQLDSDFYLGERQIESKTVMQRQKDGNVGEDKEGFEETKAQTETGIPPRRQTDSRIEEQKRPCIFSHSI